MIKNKTILITGGTGSFGKSFSQLCLKHKPKKLIIFSRDELKQFEMKNQLSKKYLKNVRFFIGDVRDVSRLKFAMENVDYVIHAAALKQVPIAEYNPFEAVKTNIIGAQNVIDACLSTKVKKVVALSTDKAAAPVNLYGSTKLASDKLFIAANGYKGNKDIKFSVVRYGNVMGSRGSVIPYFLSQKEKNFLNITDKRMTRFNITLSEGVEFVYLALKNMLGGELFVPKLSSYNIIDLANAINSKAKLKLIGIRPGEKIHEEMITETDSLHCAEFKKYFIIFPESKLINTNIKKYLKKNPKEKGKMIKKPFSYNSRDCKEKLNVEKLKKILKENNFIN